MSTKSKQEILQMLETGKINAEEAAGMLSEAAQETETATKLEVESKPMPAKEGSEREPSMFRVRVSNLDTGKNKVSVNIPVRMLKFGLKLGSRFSSELEGLDFNEISEMMTDMETGMLVEVQDEDSNEHVQVFID